MKHDILDFNPSMTTSQRVWRAVFLLALIAVLMMDLFVWRPM
jgi:hypothetical protein